MKQERIMNHYNWIKIFENAKKNSFKVKCQRSDVKSFTDKYKGKGNELSIRIYSLYLSIYITWSWL